MINAAKILKKKNKDLNILIHRTPRSGSGSGMNVA